MIGGMASSVLIVDDDPAFLSLATRVLEGMGIDVVATAQSAVTAIAVANASKPDAALVDIGLPDGDGFALTQQLRAMPWPPRVVLISSDSDGANAPAARRAGACGFFPKEELSSPGLRQLIEGVG